MEASVFPALMDVKAVMLLPQMNANSVMKDNKCWMHGRMQVVNHWRPALKYVRVILNQIKTKENVSCAIQRVNHAQEQVLAIALGNVSRHNKTKEEPVLWIASSVMLLILIWEHAIQTTRINVWPASNKMGKISSVNHVTQAAVLA